MAIIKLKIYVANLTNVMGLFDKIQVWRSETGISGMYFEITGNALAGATLLGTQTGPFTLNGLTIKYKLDSGDEKTYTFVSTDPIGIDDVVLQLNNELTGITASEDVGRLRLTSDTTGTASILEITDGTALTELGFSAGDMDYGEDERIDLQTGVTEYLYDDLSGDPDNFYKVRYFNSSTLAVSSFGDPVKGDIGSVVAPTDLVKGFGTLAGLDGKPVVGRSIFFYNVFMPPLLVGDIGIVGREVSVETDQAGYFETMMVKGATVDVVITGLGITRQITIPDTDFNVLTEMAAAEDGFTIQTPDIPAAVRRS